MQTLRKVMVANKLSKVMDIPDNMRSIKVEVIVVPYLKQNLTPRVKSLLGSFKMPKNCSIDYKKEVTEALEYKHFPSLFSMAK